MRKWFGLCAGTAAIAVAAAAPAGATVLDFTGSICTGACSNSEAISQSYGDSATIDVAYRALNSTTLATSDNFLKYWSTGYGDLSGIVWGGDSATGYISEIRLLPAAGYEVALLGFDAGCYQNRSTCRTLNYSVASVGGTAIDSASTSTLWPGHVTRNVNSAYFSDGIVLRWGPDGYDVGLDSVAFDVRAVSTGAVPEPGSWALMILGFGIAGTALRSRSRLLAAAC